MWSRKYELCTQCGLTKNAHRARGLCCVCYQKNYRQANKARIAASKKEWYEANRENLLPKQKRYREEVHFSGNREACLSRDGYTCTECGKTTQLTVHHRDHNGRGSDTPNNELENLVTLCRGCHAKHHSTNVGWSRHHECCVDCGTTEVRHSGKGLCIRCYSRKRYIYKKKNP